MHDDDIKQLHDRLKRVEDKLAIKSSAPTVPKYDLTAVAGSGSSGTLSFPTRPYAVAYAEFVDHPVSVYPTYPTFDITSPLDWSLESFSNSYYMGDGATDLSDSPSEINENAYYKIDWVNNSTTAFTIKQPGFYQCWITLTLSSNLTDYAPFWTKMRIVPSGFSYTPFMGGFARWDYWDTTKMDADSAVEAQYFQSFLITGTNVGIQAFFETSITTRPGYPNENMFALVGANKL